MTSLPGVQRPTDDTLSRVAARTPSQLPLAALLAGTALLYLVGLSHSAYANDFYAAAVKAGTQSWRAFLFGSLDPTKPADELASFPRSELTP